MLPSSVIAIQHQTIKAGDDSRNLIITVDLFQNLIIGDDFHDHQDDWDHDINHSYENFKMTLWRTWALISMIKIIFQVDFFIKFSHKENIKKIKATFPASQVLWSRCGA